jgi:hypothetical protein
MSDRIFVSGDGSLKEWDDNPMPETTPLLRVLGVIFSYLFHPLFIPVYLIGFMIIAPPYFLGFDERNKWIILVRFFVIYSFFPLVTVLLAKGLGFVESLYLRGRRERIIPYIACGIFYFWMWYVLRNQPEFPRELVLLALGIFLSSSLGLIGNIYMKVSMHAISMGIAITFMGYLTLHNGSNLAPYWMITLAIAGLVCTARLLVSNHRPVEIYLGLFIGFLCQFIAFYVDFR